MRLPAPSSTAAPGRSRGLVWKQGARGPVRPPEASASPARLARTASGPTARKAARLIPAYYLRPPVPGQDFDARASVQPAAAWARRASEQDRLDRPPDDPRPRPPSDG